MTLFFLMNITKPVKELELAFVVRTFAEVQTTFFADFEREVICMNREFSSFGYHLVKLYNSKVSIEKP